jgi:hypothetical protein
MKKFTKRTAAVAVLMGGLMAATVAYAAWTASGSGSGYAKASSAQALSTVSAAADTTAQLYPGGSGDVKIRIVNPNPYNVTVTDITGNGAIVTTDNTAACDASTGVTFTSQSSLSLVVPANSTGTLFSLTGAASMSNASDNSCQGKTFSIPVSLSGASS